MLRVLTGKINVGTLVEKRQRPTLLADRPKPRFPSRVEIDNDVSEDYTVIDVFTLDRVGILFAIANALYHLGLSIHLAKITTTVDRVFDVFYVTDNDGKKIEDAGTLALIRGTILDELKPLIGAPLAATG